MVANAPYRILPDGEVEALIQGSVIRFQDEDHFRLFMNMRSDVTPEEQQQVQSAMAERQRLAADRLLCRQAIAGEQSHKQWKKGLIIIGITLGPIIVITLAGQKADAPQPSQSATATGTTTNAPAEESTLKPKDIFKECEQCPEMVVVPAGSFTMGSPANEKERSSDEGPQHRVTFAKAFAVGQFAVTFDEWDACVADGGCNRYRHNDEHWGRGRRPVINVSWDDAKAYVAWLSTKTKKSYRLLREAEREYAPFGPQGATCAWNATAGARFWESCRPGVGLCSYSAICSTLAWMCPRRCRRPAPERQFTGLLLWSRLQRTTPRRA
jgi:formylglycine-generating enzyme required for sulfatase activity